MVLVEVSRAKVRVLTGLNPGLNSQLGALNSQSFSERVNSGANLVVNKLALKTGPEFVDMLVTLRANEPFMNFIQENKYKGRLNCIAGIESTNDGSTDHLWAEKKHSKNYY